MNIAVFGASGFVGSAVVDELLKNPGLNVVPIVHTSGNAWQLARRNMEIRLADLLDPSQIEPAMRDCTHVVNCTRGPRDVMIRGLKNLLNVCRRQQVARFVHLSSVAVYGTDLAAESISEEHLARAPQDSYGGLKAMQDEIVYKFRNQVGSSILCPPNITGLNSPFVCDLVTTMRQGSFALVGAGDNACHTIDVENLATAVKQALFAEKNLPERMFVLDDPLLPWRQMIEILASIDEINWAQISADNVKALLPASHGTKKKKLTSSLKQVVSSDVRDALSKDPIWEDSIGIISNSVKKISSKLHTKMKHSTSSDQLPKLQQNRWSTKYLSLQMRSMSYRLDRARSVFGYHPEISAEQSFSRFVNWYREVTGLNSEYRDLYKFIDT